MMMRISKASKVSNSLSSSSRKMKAKYISYTSSLIAIRTLSCCTEAFQIGSSSGSRRLKNTTCNRSLAVPPFDIVPSQVSLGLLHRIKAGLETPPSPLNTSTRKFFSQRKSSNYDDDEDKSILGKAKDKMKSIIPSFLKPKSMLTKKEQTRQDAKDNISSSIDTMLKDAPLGVRMMGKMISPLVSSVAGNLAEAMEEQSRQMNELLDDARVYIVSDSLAADELGEPIEVGTPFSQSSSSMNINGKASSRINASFEVRGSRGGGVATMDATDGKLSRLTLNVNGRTFNISLTKSAASSYKTGPTTSRRSGGIGKNRVFNEDDVIDAEFVEKKVDK